MMPHRSVIWIIAFSLIALLVTGISRAQEESEQPEPVYMDNYTGADAEMIGSDRCLMCHSIRMPDSTFSHLALFDLDSASPYYGYGCEACHGPGGNHNGNPIGIINPNKLSPDQVADLCSKCHSDLGSYNHQEWYLSGHSMTGMSCLACHGGHSEFDKFLIQDNKLELCYSCHMDKRAEFNMRSHHPVEEGQIECDSCHNLHSGLYDSQLNNDGDELCFGCHGDKQGPFAYDHDMSASIGGNGCLTCHFIHGSNTDALLRFPSRLCLQCHTDQNAENHFAGTCWSTGCHADIHGSYTSPLFFK
jgi:DmsE family decaheme c-type cytochrome